LPEGVWTFFLNVFVCYPPSNKPFHIPHLGTEIWPSGNPVRHGIPAFLSSFLPPSSPPPSPSPRRQNNGRLVRNVACKRLIVAEDEYENVIHEAKPTRLHLATDSLLWSINIGDKQISSDLEWK
jgi:hypothetical protein